MNLNPSGYDYSMLLVTGGAGFIGSHVASRLIENGEKVLCFDNLSGGYRTQVPKKSIFIKGSITNYRLLSALFERYHFTHVFHLGAYAAENLSHYIRRFNYSNNLIGSVNLINLSIKHNIKRFIFTSSIAVYGAGQTPFTEIMTPHPEDPYGIAKQAVELDLESACRFFGLHYTVFRPHNVYGEGQNLSDPHRNVVSIFMRQLLTGKPMSVYGTGSQTRAFTYIDDVSIPIASCINLSHTKNQIYNIGADKPYTVKTVAYEVAKALGKKPQIIFLKARKEVVHAFSDHSKIKKDFKIGDMVSLETGLQRMSHWARNQKIKTPKPFSHPELTYLQP